MRTRDILRVAFGVAVLTAVGPAVAQQERPRERPAGAESRKGERSDEGQQRPGGDREAQIERLRWEPEDVREVMLLLSPQVREELKLTEEQGERAGKAAREVAERHREAFQGLGQAEGRERFEKFRDLVRNASSELHKELKGILKPEQSQRLEQLALQFAGPRALTDPEFRDQLDLTEDQERRLRAIGEEFGRSVRDLPRDPEDRDEARQKYRALWRETRGKVADVLTAEQKAKWRELAGEPFDFDLRPGRPGDGDDDREGAGRGRGGDRERGAEQGRGGDRERGADPGRGADRKDDEGRRPRPDREGDRP